MDPEIIYKAGVVDGIVPSQALLTPDGTGYVLLQCKSEDQVRTLMHLKATDPIPYVHVSDLNVGNSEDSHKLDAIKQIINS